MREPPAILTATRDRLAKVVAEDAFPCTTSHARRYLKLAEKMIAEPSSWADAHWFGVNGYGPAVDDICREAEFHKANRFPVHPPREQQACRRMA